MSMRHTGAVIAAALLLLLNAACAPRDDYRGTSIDEEKLKQVVVGQTTEAQVATLLGSPSTSSTFPDWGTTYYYISSETEAVDRKSVVSGNSVSVRVDLGGRRIIKKNIIIKNKKN